MESLQPIQFGSTHSYLWKPEYHINHPEEIQDFLSCTCSQGIRPILIYTNLPYLVSCTLNALKEFLQVISQDERPYYPSRRFRIISGRLLNRGIIHKLSRYKSSKFSLLKAQIELTASFQGAIKAFSSKESQ
ncbi:hypothetical protein IGI04_034752 [Brassica rapa subsp. trilocularis]|uniref:Uncharacterized protein n=1 Tax=Brassica rapa subsp. trilocularis TaxID=1813537 RepID=A0ABQ7L9N2_BRACM|nr:hypothetical protein IGI04_034752 [Brassica rapa subsp. trilocularis]